MGRRKKSAEEKEEILEPTLDSTEKSEEIEAKAEAKEETEATGSEAESAAESEVKTESEGEAKPKPRRRRRSRKSKPSLLETMSSEEAPTPIEEEKTAEAERIVSTEANEPVDDSSLRKDAAMASVAIQRSMDSMAKQWTTIKEISQSICSNFEQTATHLSELQDSYTQTLQEVSKIQSRRPTIITKTALGVSAFAIILSIISLSLSQSARTAVLSQSAAKTAEASANHSTASIQVNPVAPPIASNDKTENTTRHQKEIQSRFYPAKRRSFKR